MPLRSMTANGVNHHGKMITRLRRAKPDSENGPDRERNSAAGTQFQAFQPDRDIDAGGSLQAQWLQREFAEPPTRTLAPRPTPTDALPCAPA
jgi:hypothetical protein